MTRRIVIGVNAFGIAVTEAIEAEGHADWSSNVDLAVLGSLALHGPMRPRDLLGPTKLTRGGLSNLLDRHESAGLVERTYGQVPGDRRGAMIALSEHGRTTIEQIAAAVQRVLDERRADTTELVGVMSSVAPARRRRRRTSMSAIGKLDVIGRVGAILGDSVGSIDPDDPAPTKTLIVLCSAAQEHGTRPRNLIDSTRLSSGGVTLLLDRLEEADLIRRHLGAPSDRRAVTIELTAEGRRHLDGQLTRLAAQLDSVRALFEELARPS